MLAGIAGSTILAWVLFEPFTDPSRIYYGTDTRAVCLLAGVALAFLWPANRLRPLTERRPRIVLEATGVAAVVVLGSPSPASASSTPRSTRAASCGWRWRPPCWWRSPPTPAR